MIKTIIAVIFDMISTDETHDTQGMTIIATILTIGIGGFSNDEKNDNCEN